MIIDINIDRSRLEKEIPDNNSIRKLYSEVARFAGKGYHRIIVNPDIIECIRFTGFLNSLQIAQIEKLCERFYELSALASEGNPYLKVNYGNERLSKCNGSWQIGHIRLLGGNYLEKTILLVESDDDIDFYEFLLKAEAKRISFGHIVFEPNDGGGSSTFKTFKRHIEQRRIVLCVGDSDKKFPDDEFGQTFTSLKKLKDKQGDDFVGKLDCTPGREIENFLPIEIVHKVSRDGDRKFTKNLNYLIEQQGNVESGDCLWLYYDVKKGYNCKKLQKLFNSGSEEQKSWLRRKYKAVEFKIPQKSCTLPFGIGIFFNRFCRYIANSFKIILQKWFEFRIFNEESNTSVSYDEHTSNINCNNLPKYDDGVLGKFVKNESAKKNFKAHMKEEGGYWELHYSNWVQSLLWYVCGEEPRYDRED